ncbi:TPA: hypothetical protein DF272_06900 [Candidatus Falkowbacteria bacterium]|nr:hypothetical protein [Candidatus Falkowbacteria bacterium]
MSLKSICVFGGSFNPPGIHHLHVAERLVQCKRFDVVLIVPCGLRPDKNPLYFVAPSLREAMVLETFGDVCGVWFDLSDIAKDEFTRTYDLDVKIRERFAPADVWHFVGSDLLVGGVCGQSEIQRSWYRGQDLWANLSFVTTIRPGYPLSAADQPPHYLVVETNRHGASTEIRHAVASGGQFHELVVPGVARLITENHLYGY